MKIYLVRRITDENPYEEYGVSEHYYAVGLFAREEDAIKAKEQAEALPAKFETEIDIVEMEINKVYPIENQIYLGGAQYLE